MDGDEWALSRSTPGARFDAAAAAQAAAALPTVTPQARRRMAAAIDDPAHPVIMFGLEWCEFCWTLRRFFERIGVALHRIDLDTPALHAEAADWRAALHAHTGQLTIPQVFVAGQWLGGCVDALDAWRDGRLQRQLQALGVAFDAAAVPDPQALLPAWLQPRSSR
jgi:cysteine synthase A